VIIALLSDMALDPLPMTKAKSSRLIKSIIDEAKASGELKHRIFLVKEEIKALHLQSQDYAAFLKSRHLPESWRTKDAKDALRERRQFLVRQGYLQQSELDQLERLSGEIESLLKETTSDLLEKIARG
jgi:hypothetical protein